MIVSPTRSSLPGAGPGPASAAVAEKSESTMMRLVRSIIRFMRISFPMRLQPKRRRDRRRFDGLSGVSAAEFT
jgi:hypothetical protein